MQERKKIQTKGGWVQNQGNWQEQQQYQARHTRDTLTTIQPCASREVRETSQTRDKSKRETDATDRRIGDAVGCYRGQQGSRSSFCCCSFNLSSLCCSVLCFRFSQRRSLAYQQSHYLNEQLNTEKTSITQVSNLSQNNLESILTEKSQTSLKRASKESTKSLQKSLKRVSNEHQKNINKISTDKLQTSLKRTSKEYQQSIYRKPSSNEFQKNIKCCRHSSTVQCQKW